jgi:hypothetical protein
MADMDNLVGIKFTGESVWTLCEINPSHKENIDRQRLQRPSISSWTMPSMAVMNWRKCGTICSITPSKYGF